MIKVPSPCGRYIHILALAKSLPYLLLKGYSTKFLFKPLQCLGVSGYSDGGGAIKKFLNTSLHACAIAFTVISGELGRSEELIGC